MRINYLLNSLMVLILSLAIVSYAKAQNTAQTFAPEQVKQIEKIVHEYLIRNPHVMVQVFQELQKEQQKQAESQAQQAIRANVSGIFLAKNSPVLGNPQGKVTLVEFFDYQCPHCKKMVPIIDSLIKKNPELRIVYKELPIFPGSDLITKASLAAQNQGKYAEFHKALMDAPVPTTQETVYQLAQKVGLDVDALKKDMDSKAVEDEIKGNISLANSLGLAGTPAFIIGSHIDNVKNMRTYYIPGQVAEDTLQKAISEALATKSKKANES